MKKLILLSFAIVLINSCKKTGNGYVHGTLIEEGTGLPVANAKVVFSLERGRDEGIWNDLDSSSTDAGGHFKFNYRKERNASYKFRFTEKDHWPNEIVSIFARSNKKSELTFFINPIAYLKVRVRKTVPSIKTLTILNHFFIATGSDNTYDTLLKEVLRIPANTEFEIFWYVNHMTSAHVENAFFSKKVRLNKGDTLLYSIDFQ